MNRYLTFDLDECYAIDMNLVAEVIPYKPVTPVPGTPPYIAGVINLRGAVIPVIDMRVRFLKEQREDLLRRCILIINFGEMVIGLLADKLVHLEEINFMDVPEITAENEG